MHQLAHAGSILLLFVSALANSAAATAAPVATAKVVAEFARGSGLGELGVTEDSEDALPVGPNGLIDATGGGVLILDTVNNRILRVSDGGKIDVAAAVAGAGLAQDIVRAGRAVYVLDSQPLFIGIDVGAGKIGADKSTEAAGGRRRAPALFETNGAVLSESSAGVPEASEEKSGTGKWLSAPGVGGDTDQYRVIQRDDGSASVEVRPGGNRNNARILKLPIRADRLGSIGLIGRDKAGRSYVRVEEFSSHDGTGRTKVWVVRYDSRARLAGGYDVPDDAMELVPNRYLAVTAAGTVYFLESRRDKTRLLKLAVIAASKFPGYHQSVMAGTDGIAAPPAVPAGAENEAAVKKVARSDIIKLAEGYRSAEWTLSRKNFRPDMLSACEPDKGQLWRRPPHLDKMEGKLIVGVPYNWGGSMSVAEFQDRITKSAVAGNVCTCRSNSNCVDRKIAGVDCSGFISQVWQVKHHTTASLGTVGKKLNSFQSLQPGDVLNKPNSHVRLFAGRSPSGNGTIRAYESSVSCGGVCLRDFTSKQLEGYVALAAPASD